MSRGAPAPVITLDGPGGAGKGTLAALLAQELGWSILDSGALYRLVGLIALRHGLAVENTADHARAVDAARGLAPVFEPDPAGGQRVWLDGENVTAAIRDDAVSQAASRWAAQTDIRAALLASQRAFAVAPGLLADGRDMGTVVFRAAELKLFVTASARERARRRHAQLSANGVDANLARIYRQILQRDRRDAQRAISPLAPAVDAHVIDTTGQTAADSLARVRSLVQAKGWL